MHETSPFYTLLIPLAATLTALAFQLPIEQLLIPPSAYLFDRQLAPHIDAPYVTGRRAFSAAFPLPQDESGRSRLPRVLRETSSFVLLPNNVASVGVFRISPPARLLSVLREAYDRGQRFITWRDNGHSLPWPEYPDAVDGQTIYDELDTADTYGVVLAASLIKEWYRYLREPLFPASCYVDLRKLFCPVSAASAGNGLESDAAEASAEQCESQVQLQTTPNHVPIQSLVDLFSTSSGRSIIPQLSQEIAVRHLLPLLASVARHEQSNLMSAQNLAVCFAPALLNGPDQTLDAKMSSVVRRIIAAAVEVWDSELRERLGVSEDAFERDISAPVSLNDYEDALLERVAAGQYEQYDQRQRTGVVSGLTEESVGTKPPLPPRPMSSTFQPLAPSNSTLSIEETLARRKPVPAPAVLPRYSTIIPSDQISDGFAPPDYLEHHSGDDDDDDDEVGQGMEKAI